MLFTGFLRSAALCALLWGVAACADDQPATAGLALSAPVAAEPLTLEQAVALARSQDPWLRSSHYREQAMQEESVAAGALPDPLLSLGLANLPADRLSFGREPMTQFRVGVSQMFPRGDTRALRRRQLRERSTEQPPQRRDFFSLGLSFDMPLFRANRQDREVQAARARQAAVNNERTLALRAMRASILALRARLERLNQRKALYAGRLLREIGDQAEAALTAYTHDAGDFAEAVRARIAALNANIDFLHIDIDRRLTMAELNYFLSPPGEGSARETSP